MTIELLSEKLTFVRLASGAIHARHANWTLATMCGKAIPDGTQPMSYRSAYSTEVCKRCIASLRTYTRGTPPQVQFTQEQEQA